MEIEIVAQSNDLNLVECPRFDEAGNLYFGDALGTGLYRLTLTSGIESIDESCRSVGGCVMHQDGGVIYSGRGSLMFYDPVARASRPIATAMGGDPFGSVNDFEADANGNIYGGTLDFAAFDRGEAPKPGFMFRLDTTGKVVRLREVGIPNGIAFSSDAKHLFYSESGEGVFCYDVDGVGDLSNRRMFADLQDSDGIVLDQSGGLWVARYMHSTIAYYDAEGNLAREVETPFKSVASVVFGGESLLDLYVTGGALDETGTGGIIRMHVEVPGLRTHKARVPVGQ